MDLVIRSFRESDKDEVIGLWKECNLVVPWNDPQRDIERKLTVQSELFLIGVLNDKIIAVSMILSFSTQISNRSDCTVSFRSISRC